MTLPSACGCYEDTGGFHPCFAHSGSRTVSAPDIISPTPIVTITPPPMPDPLTPEGREREAREALELIVYRYHPATSPSAATMDAYRDAVLAAERERIAREVEGMRLEHTHPCNEARNDFAADNPWRDPNDFECECRAGVHNAAIDRALAIVRGTA